MKNTTMCTVKMDGKVMQSNDFVAILSRENGDASIYYNTDALTLGMAMKMVARAFVECLNKCDDSERDSVASILGPMFGIGLENREAPNA